jgi:hypothetical protein
MADPATRRRSAPRKAIATGEQLAAEAERRRMASLRRRRLALSRVPPRARAEAAATRITAAMVRRAGGTGSLGTLIAEGDSWFDYPGRDVLTVVREAGYDVEKIAHFGHTIEDMAYSAKQIAEFDEVLAKLVRRSIVPKAILVSAGGNDVAGDQFAMLLNHRLSPTPGLNLSVVSGVIDDRVRQAYITKLAAMTAVCRRLLATELPILVHGYDWPVPDGRGVLGGWGILPGPWLEPGFRQKGFDRKNPTQFDATIGMMETLINRFNAALKAVTRLPDFAHVRYVDLRGTLSNGAQYSRWWANELHPTDRGFTAIGASLVAALNRL